MKPESQWLSTNFAREIFDMMPVIIKDKQIGEIKGHVEVEHDDGKGRFVVLAMYDSCPFAGTQNAASFYLTQQQLDEYLSKGATCVLNPPEKNKNV